jgi:hypothetical protein
MAAPTFKTASFIISGCHSTLVSDIVQDQTTGKYVRLIQFFDVTQDTMNARPVLEVSLSGDAALDVELQTPKLSF